MEHGKREERKTMDEEVQLQTVVKDKKKCKYKAKTAENRGVQERSVRCFGCSILGQGLHTPWLLTDLGISQTPRKPHTIA